MVGNGTNVGALFILYMDSLLAKGLETLLKDIGMSPTVFDLKEDGAWERLNEALLPGDVVIVDKRDVRVHPSLSINQLFMQHTEITIIGVDPFEATVDLYKRQAQVVKQPEELAELISYCWPNIRSVKEPAMSR